MSNAQSPIVSAQTQSPKLFAGHAQAMGRLGVHELRNAAYTGANVAASGETGLYGTATPQEVHEQQMSVEPSPLESALQRARKRLQTTCPTQRPTQQP